jgi:rod shape-determining protein MreC
VEVGDEIVTSGLGGRFPAGFPVGTITGLRPDDTHAFLLGELKPAAQLDRGRDVLLLRPGAAIRIPPNLRLHLEETAPGGPATGTAVPAPTAPPATSPAAGPASVAATPAPATATPAAPSPAEAASTVPQATEPPPPAAETQR